MVFLAMTPTERATKIAEICGQNAKRIQDEIVPLIAAQIEEAVLEVKTQKLEWAAKEIEDAVLEAYNKAARDFNATQESLWKAHEHIGFAAAREKAAGVAWGHPYPCECRSKDRARESACPEEIAQAIRAMEPDK